MPGTILNLEGIMKAGAITPQDVRLDGELDAKTGRTFVNDVVANHDLLGRVTVDIAGALTKKRSGLSVSKGLLQRHTPGKALTESQLAKLATVGAKLDMQNGVELRAHINDDTLLDNQDNTNFDNEQYEVFTTAFSNDIVYLGWVGTADNDDAGAPFNELSKGWLTVAAESDLAIKETSSTNTDKGKEVENALYKVIDAADEDIVEDITIYLNPRDYRAYVRMIGKEMLALQLLKEGNFLTLEGIPLSPQKGIPEGTYLGTPEKNMVLGFPKKIKRKRWYEDDIDSLCYKFVVYPDYEFDIKKYVTLVTVSA